MLPDILLHRIFPFLDRRSKFSLGGTCKENRLMILSPQASKYWNNDGPFEFCIDSYCCPVCPLKRNGFKTSGALSILSNFPFQMVKMHGFVTNIPDFLTALSHKKTIVSLHLAITNKANSPPLCDLLPNDLTGDMFPNLTELVLDSAHLQHVNPAGRHRLLCILGERLISLSFLALSPSHMFTMVKELCPNLRTLRVDKACSLEDLALYRNNNLESLELCRADFLLTVHLQLPRLRRLRFTPARVYDTVQFTQMISVLNPNILELCLEVPSEMASSLLPHIATRLPQLRNLKLEGSYMCGKLDVAELSSLCTGCPSLHTFEVFSARSVSTLGFQNNAFHVLGSFPSLRRVRVMYEETVVADLALTLSTSRSLSEVVLWERMRWSSRPWTMMRLRVSSIASAFPTTNVSLEDVS